MSGTRGVIAIGGIDPTGGAGLTADIAFLSDLRLRVGTVVTALTVQDDDAVRRVVPVEASLVAEQFDAAVRTFGSALGALKTGLVADDEQAAIVASEAARLGIPLVCDPVFVAGTGDRFHDSDPGRALAPLLDVARVITPNIDEAVALSGRAWDGTHRGLEILAALLATDRRVAAVSGGHGTGPTVALAVAGPSGVRLDEAPRRPADSTHGTGCAMAATTAGLMALGRDAENAAIEAHRRVARSVVGAAGIPGCRICPEPWAR